MSNLGDVKALPKLELHAELPQLQKQLMRLAQRVAELEAKTKGMADIIDEQQATIDKLQAAAGAQHATGDRLPARDTRAHGSLLGPSQVRKSGHKHLRADREGHRPAHGDHGE